MRRLSKCATEPLWAGIGDIEITGGAWVDKDLSVVDLVDWVAMHRLV